ncbi:unnamed protein product [Spirodela intermedia]|uniref:Uncharacterized protein n=1 Tax=Spirodela intermedia TaxID=51605 RepID=A0A7I8JFZ2_SPIIN|nr:unnamed protein product [Spirodela intermedia]CAA6669088.1 unnamed protein product [Spirodela intermedia]
MSLHLARRLSIWPEMSTTGGAAGRSGGRGWGRGGR